MPFWMCAQLPTHPGRDRGDLRLVAPCGAAAMRRRSSGPSAAGPARRAGRAQCAARSSSCSDSTCALSTRRWLLCLDERRGQPAQGGGDHFQLADPHAAAARASRRRRRAPHDGSRTRAACSWSKERRMCHRITSSSSAALMASSTMSSASCVSASRCSLACEAIHCMVHGGPLGRGTFTLTLLELGGATSASLNAIRSLQRRWPPARRAIRSARGPVLSTRGSADAGSSLDDSARSSIRSRSASLVVEALIEERASPGPARWPRPARRPCRGARATGRARDRSRAHPPPPPARRASPAGAAPSARSGYSPSGRRSLQEVFPVGKAEGGCPESTDAMGGLRRGREVDDPSLRMPSQTQPMNPRRSPMQRRLRDARPGPAGPGRPRRRASRPGTDAAPTAANSNRWS